jgi:hypothetical protein
MGPPPSTTPASVGHVKTHCDAMQLAVPGTVPAAGGRHCVPHVTQFWLSLVRSKQPGSPGQDVFGATQGAWHCEATQMSPVVQMCPQPPQLVQSVCVSASQVPPPPLLLPLLPPLLDESACPPLPDSVDASSPLACGPVPPVAQATNDATATAPPRTRTETTVAARER